MAKRQVRVSKPNLHHEPSNGPEGPFFRAERPKRKKQPRETRGRDAHEKNEFSCHGTERAMIGARKLLAREVRRKQGRRRRDTEW